MKIQPHSNQIQIMHHFPIIAAALLLLLSATPAAMAQPIVNANWVGDANGDGIWGDPTAWASGQVPNNGNGGNNYNVTIQRNPNGLGFNGPVLTLDITINNLTLVDRALVNGGIAGGLAGPGFSLTVLGSTSFTVATPGQGTGLIQSANATDTLGTLTNYDAATQTLMSGGFGAFSGDVTRPSVVQWHGADIVTNNGLIFFNGVNTSLRNQDNGADALANFATNNGQLDLLNGHVTSTAGNFVNNGVVVISGDPGMPTAVLRVNGNFANNGPAFLNSGGQIAVTGNVTNSGTIDLGDFGGDTLHRVTAARLDMTLGSVLTGSGSVSGNVFTQGRVEPGHAPGAGAITIQGGFTLQSTAALAIEIGGLTAGMQFDQVLQLGGAGTVLGGTLELSFINNFDISITSANTFQILISDQTLSGTFSNVASGGRLLTTDGLGSFIVSYNGSSVILSNFQAVPEPSTFVMLLGGLGVLFCLQRPRSRFPR